MKRMLWIGNLENEEEFKIKAQKGYHLASAQVSQQNFLNGMERVSGHIFDSINGSILPPYPIYADRIVEPVIWNHKENAFDISVGYKNNKYINRVNCKNAMIVAAKEWIEDKYNGGELTVLVYSMRSAPMATACYIKKAVPEARIYLIVTDLPKFMDLGQSKLKAFLKFLDWKFIKKMQKEFDGFILYASNMADFLEIPDGKWMLMEGSYDGDEQNLDDITEYDKKVTKVIMYSGKLDKQYGLDMLVDAFMDISIQNVELWITGGGTAEDYIKECATKDERIKFYGFLPCRADVLRIQKQASILVNMRLPSEPASDYCFPSKLLEYMATGVPVLSFKLGGIPEEYYQYLVLVEDESREAVKSALLKGLALGDRDELGKAAADFVLHNKTAIEQCKRVTTFINRIK